MTVSAFCSVSLQPPLVLACIDRTAEMLPVLRQATHCGVSILSEDQEHISRRFAELPEGRFEGVGFTRGESGVALLDDALAHLECRLMNQYDGGDHVIFVARVEDASSQPGRPLVYYRGGYAQMER
jgi:flavin reductase (DIM6/NTAB) family NADH-FMN oxidoreductase RutF